MVAVNYDAHLAAWQTFPHQIFYCSGRLGGEFYWSSQGEDYGLVFWHDLSQGRFEATDEPQNHLVEPQAKPGGHDPLFNLSLDRIGNRHRGHQVGQDGFGTEFFPP